MARPLDLAGWHQPPPGRLRVLERVASDQKGRTCWRCRCDCGKEIVAKGVYLVNGDVRSCGCLFLEATVAKGRAKLKDLAGWHQPPPGRLLILERVESADNGDARWLCRCDCGKESVHIGSQLRSGAAQSCGCLQRELMIARAAEVGAMRRVKRCVICGKFYRAIGPQKYCRRKCYRHWHRIDESLKRQEQARIKLTQQAAELAAQLKGMTDGKNKS